jgi:O-antigen/teichoic acid export membrane protein
VATRGTDPTAPESTTPPRPGFAGSALLTWSANVGSAFFSLGSILIVARVLGPDGRGRVALLTAIALLTANLATLGVQEANANLAASDPPARPSLATNSVLLALALGAFAVAIVIGLVTEFPDVAGASSRTLLWITLSFVPVLILEIFLLYLVQADYGFRVSNTAALLGPVIAFAGNALFAALGILSVESAVGAWLAGQAIGTAILAWYVWRRLAGFGRLDVSLARLSMSFGLRAYAGRVMQIGNYRLDQWLLGAIGGTRQLGLYSVAVAWAEALWYLPTALAAVQRPDLVRADGREAGRQAVRVFRGTTLVTAISALAMIALAPVLCVAIFGEAFRGSVDQLRVLVLGAFGMVAVKLLGNALVARGRPMLQSACLGVGFACTVGFDVLLIPPFGGLGAAIASSVAYTVAGAVVGTIFLRVLERRPIELVPRIGDVGWILRQLRRRLGRGRAAAEGVVAP